MDQPWGDGSARSLPTYGFDSQKNYKEAKKLFHFATRATNPTRSFRRLTTKAHDRKQKWVAGTENQHLSLLALFLPASQARLCQNSRDSRYFHSFPSGSAVQLGCRLQPSESSGLSHKHPCSSLFKRLTLQRCTQEWDFTAGRPCSTLPQRLRYG